MPLFARTSLIGFALALTPLLLGAKGQGCSGESEEEGDNGTGSPNCEPLCDAFATADCPNTPSRDACLRNCLSLTSSSSCDSTAQAYYDCTVDSAVACTSNGDPYFPGCGDEWLYAMECAVTSNPNPAIEEPCSDHCENVQAADCENSSPEDYCYTSCLWSGNTGIGCDGEWSTYLSCATAGPMECALGYAYAPGCGDEWLDYVACVNAAGG